MKYLSLLFGLAICKSKDRYIIPAPLQEYDDKSYLFANTVAIVLFSALFLSVIISIRAVAKSITAEFEMAEKLALKKKKEGEVVSIKRKEMELTPIKSESDDASD